MSEKVWTSLLSDLSSTRYRGKFAFHNYNEPLADPMLLERVTQARTMLTRATLTVYTNGDFLNRSMLEQLNAAGLNEVLVTLYPNDAHAFDPPKPKRADSFLNRLGLRGSRVVRKASKLTREARFEGVKLVVRIPRIAHYNDRAGSVELEDLVQKSKPRTAPCYLPFQGAAIDYLGNLKLCCHIYDTTKKENAPYVIGNVGETPFRRLWESARMEARRRQLSSADFSKLPACQNCSHKTPPHIVRQFEGRTSLGERHHL